MRNPHLPQEILLEIFSRIPTKSIGKCRTLSKSWNTHLSTSDFIKKHLTFRKQTTQQENLALTTDVGKVYIVTSPTKSDQVLQIIGFTSPFLMVAGSCDGLILLNDMTLFNPITLKRLRIQPCPLTKHHQDIASTDTSYGFGYDSCSNDYKIVQIFSYRSEDDVFIRKTLVDIYSVKNGVWKRLVDDYPYGQFVPHNFPIEVRDFVNEAFFNGAFLNGALHWLLSRFEYRSCIAAFDLANEVFREIPLPEGFVRQLPDTEYGISNRVSVAGGCLLIVDNHGNGRTDVWILREYGAKESWVKFLIESEYRNCKWDAIFTTLCYVEEGELLCITSVSSENVLFVCDLKGGTMRRVVLGECDDAWLTSGITFVDSLVSPEGSW